MFKYMMLSLLAAISFGLQASENTSVTLKPEQATAYGMYRFKDDTDRSIECCLLICKIRPSGKWTIDRCRGFDYRVSLKEDRDLDSVEASDGYAFIQLDEKEDSIRLEGKQIVLSLSDKTLAEIKKVPTCDKQFIHLQTSLCDEKAQEIWDAQECIVKELEDKEALPARISSSLEKIKRWFD